MPRTVDRFDDQAIAVSEPGRPELLRPRCWAGMCRTRLNRSLFRWADDENATFQGWYCFDCCTVYAQDNMNVIGNVSRTSDIIYLDSLTRFTEPERNAYDDSSQDEALQMGRTETEDGAYRRALLQRRDAELQEEPILDGDPDYPDDDTFSVERIREEIDLLRSILNERREGDEELHEAEVSTSTSSPTYITGNSFVTTGTGFWNSPYDRWRLISDTTNSHTNAD